jgi:hypothetical protein
MVSLFAVIILHFMKPPQNVTENGVFGKKIGFLYQAEKYPCTFWIQTKLCPIKVHPLYIKTLQ